MWYMINMNHGKARVIRTWLLSTLTTIMTQSGKKTHTLTHFWIMFKHSFPHAPKVVPIIFSPIAVLQPQIDCFSLHYLCTRLTGRWVERWWMESGRVGNRGTVRHSGCVVWTIICRLSRWDRKDTWDVARPYLRASLRCPLNQRWHSLMVHYRHALQCLSSTSLSPLSLSDFIVWIAATA